MMRPRHVSLGTPGWVSCFGGMCRHVLGRYLPLLSLNSGRTTRKTTPLLTVFGDTVVRLAASVLPVCD